MAIHADTAWEFRTGGDNTNGGGFRNSNPGTSVDHSQQVAAQLSLTDLAMVTGGTTLTSATGGFTAAMAGNLIYIASGTNFTAGWYEVAAYTDTNTVTLDRDATSGGNGSSGAGKVGGCLAVPTTAWDTNGCVPGNSVHQQDGTYVLTGALTITKQLRWYGYKTTRGDEPVEADRPLINCGANACEFRQMGVRQFLAFTTTAALGVNARGVLDSCTFTQSSAVHWRYAVYTYENSLQLSNSKIVSPDNQGLGAVAKTCFVDHCHFDVYNTGVWIFQGYHSNVTNCIFVDGLTGVHSDCRGGQVTGNTCHGCGVGINLSAGYGYTKVVRDNILDGCTTGISGSTTHLYSDLFDYNNYHDNTTDVLNATKGSHATAHDPKFVDDASDDYRLQADSLCATAGMPMTLGTGGNTVTTYQGAVPPVASAGGGSATRLVGGVLVG